MNGSLQITTELKKALMQNSSLKASALNPKKQTEIGPTPENWEVVELGQITESLQHGASVRCCYDVDGKSVLRIPNVVDLRTLNSTLLSEYSRTETGASFLSGQAARTADGKFNINSGTLKTTLVPVPAIEEQGEISQNLAIIDKKTANDQSKRTNLQGLSRTILHKLMTAKIRVPVNSFPKP